MSKFQEWQCGPGYLHYFMHVPPTNIILVSVAFHIIAEKAYQKPIGKQR